MAAFAKGKPKTGGRAKGTPNKATEAVRRLVNDNAADIVAKLIEQAKGGDAQAQATFIRMLPRHRVVMSSIELQPAKDSDQAKLQIGALVSEAAAGRLDLDSVKVLVDALRICIDGRQSELEALVRELVEKHEDSAA